MKIPYGSKTLLLDILIVLDIIACIWVREKHLITLDWILCVLLLVLTCFAGHGTGRGPDQILYGRAILHSQNLSLCQEAIPARLLLDTGVGVSSKLFF